MNKTKAARSLLAQHDNEPELNYDVLNCTCAEADCSVSMAGIAFISAGLSKQQTLSSAPCEGPSSAMFAATITKVSKR